VAGVPDVAKRILEHPDLFHPTDPILQMYTDAMAKDGGKTLTLEQMKQTAKKGP
jgi:hypothetical protein